MSINKDIIIGYPIPTRNPYLNEIINPFTIIIIPDNIKTIQRSNIISYNNVKNFFNDSNYFPDVSTIEEPEEADMYKIGNGLYIWKNINIDIFEKYFMQLNEIYNSFEVVYSMNNNFANNYYLLKKRTYSAILVEEERFSLSDIEYYYDLMYEAGYNFYFDTGLSKNISFFTAQVEALSDFTGGESRKFMFGSINLPPMYRTPTGYNLNPSNFNMFISAGYLNVQSTERFAYSFKENLGDINSYTVYDMIALIPGSTYYAFSMMDKYSNRNAYKSIVNKPVAVVVDGTDYIYDKQTVNNFKDKGVNALYIDKGIAKFITNITPQNISPQATMLKRENAARMALDIGRELTNLLYAIIGTNIDEQEIDTFIKSVEQYIIDKYITMSDVAPADFKMSFQKLSDTNIRVDIILRFPNMIEEVVLLSLIYP